MARRKNRVGEEEKIVQRFDLMAFEMKVDEARILYNCKKVPRLVSKQVFKSIGASPEGWQDAKVLESFFLELQKQRPDLFNQPLSPKATKPQGCLVCVLFLMLLVVLIAGVRSLWL